MSPLVHIRKRDKVDKWLRIDFSDIENPATIIVIPAFGPDHRAGWDCWCRPTDDEGVCVHNAHH